MELWQARGEHRATGFPLDEERTSPLSDLQSFLPDTHLQLPGFLTGTPDNHVPITYSVKSCLDEQQLFDRLCGHKADKT